MDSCDQKWLRAQNNWGGGGGLSRHSEPDDLLSFRSNSSLLHQSYWGDKVKYKKCKTQMKLRCPFTSKVFLSTTSPYVAETTSEIHLLHVQQQTDGFMFPTDLRPRTGWGLQAPLMEWSFETELTSDLWWKDLRPDPGAYTGWRPSCSGQQDDAS